MNFATENDCKPASQNDPKPPPIPIAKPPPETLQSTPLELSGSVITQGVLTNQGLNISVPMDSKSATFRVTTVIP